MMGILRKLTPPDRWKIPVIILLGIFFGLGAFTFHISKAPSYLSDKPETCINCHIMVPEYSTWAHSAHREYTNCNDCHVPHNNMLNHYYFKAMDGLRHASIFTLRTEPQVIQIKDAGANAVQNNCIRCHEDVINDTRMMRPDFSQNNLRKDRKCWECHREVPHGRVKGL
ncbi:MAG: cytochrome c nitrite reductase small subunit, partial [Perlabentimonas sp.]